MAAVIIKKKDLDRLAKNLLKEVYNFLHDDYILTNFQEMKIEQKKFQRNIILRDFRSRNFTETQTDNSLTRVYDELDENDNIKEKLEILKDILEKNESINIEDINKVYDEPNYEKKLKVLEDDIKNELFSTEVIFDTLIDIKLDEEIDGDLYFKNEAFLDIYRVFEYSHSYLED